MGGVEQKVRLGRDDHTGNHQTDGRFPREPRITIGPRRLEVGSPSSGQVVRALDERVGNFNLPENVRFDGRGPLQMNQDFKRRERSVLGDVNGQATAMMPSAVAIEATLPAEASVLVRANRCVPIRYARTDYWKLPCAKPRMNPSTSRAPTSVSSRSIGATSCNGAAGVESHCETASSVVKRFFARL
jgi:hypothetical protein